MFIWNVTRIVKFRILLTAVYTRIPNRADDHADQYSESYW